MLGRSEIRWNRAPFGTEGSACKCSANTVCKNQSLASLLWQDRQPVIDWSGVAKPDSHLLRRDLLVRSRDAGDRSTSTDHDQNPTKQ